jgi:hypothetical protein
LAGLRNRDMEKSEMIPTSCRESRVKYNVEAAGKFLIFERITCTTPQQ